MVVELGGCDHFCADGVGYLAKLAYREKSLEGQLRRDKSLMDRKGRGVYFMVALGPVDCASLAGE